VGWAGRGKTQNGNVGERFRQGGKDASEVEFLRSFAIETGQAYRGVGLEEGFEVVDDNLRYVRVEAAWTEGRGAYFPGGDFVVLQFGDSVGVPEVGREMLCGGHDAPERVLRFRIILAELKRHLAWE
jgi:hypothetical protein